MLATNSILTTFKERSFSKLRLWVSLPFLSLLFPSFLHLRSSRPLVVFFLFLWSLRSKVSFIHSLTLLLLFCGFAHSFTPTTGKNMTLSFQRNVTLKTRTFWDLSTNRFALQFPYPHSIGSPSFSFLCFHQNLCSWSPTYPLENPQIPPDNLWFSSHSHLCPQTLKISTFGFHSSPYTLFLSFTSLSHYTFHYAFSCITYTSPYPPCSLPVFFGRVSLSHFLNQASLVPSTEASSVSTTPTPGNPYPPLPRTTYNP